MRNRRRRTSAADALSLSNFARVVDAVQVGCATPTLGSRGCSRVADVTHQKVTACVARRVPKSSSTKPKQAQHARYGRGQRRDARLLLRRCHRHRQVVSLKSSSVATPNATTSSKSPAPEEARLSGKPESPSEAREAALVDSKKGSSSDENKENMTVKDIEVATAKVVEEKVKPVKDDEKKREGSGEEVMSGMEIDEDQQDCTYRNGSKTEDFNDELTFQMDGGSGGGSQQSSNGDDDTEEGDDDEEQEEQGAVDLSSSTETVNKPEEPAESSSEKSVTKPAQKPEVPVEEPDLSSVEKTVKVEPVEQPEERREEASSVDLSSKTSRKEKPVSRKRRRSVEEYEDEEDAEPVMPSKKLKRELECNFRAHDLLLKEYIENTSNDSMEDVHKNTELLQVEIQTLNDMIRAKENEWNNMIHLKKVKEEILMRLTRKKNVLNIVHTKLGEEPPADYSLSNVRSASVGPRPPTPPPEVDIRPASVTPLHSSRQSANTSTANDSRRSAPSTNSSSLFAQFNHINSSVTMVPLSTSPSLITSTNTILQSRANMKPAELAKEKPNAAQIQRQILPKPILSNHQQILNNLAMSAGLTAANVTSSTISNTTSSASSSNTMAAAAIAANNILAGLGLSAQAAALLNGHHNPGGHQNQHNINNQLQVGRQGVIKDVKSIIADYRQKHPEQVPRRGRRLKNIPSYDGKGGSSADARMRELSFLLAAAEDDEAEDSVDRLVIDEGDDHHGHHDGHVNNSGGGGGHHQRNHRGEPSVVITARGGGGGNGPEFHENDVPECQGCKKREAQFVCAGCGNQWYCSRECQVNAWDDHSEVCTG
ncbi:hypothetical protein pipiens_010628 [Culex pipiens pipiens]|uniref:MYND-type domain-containing protein n=1 Tax=Culex pipiens pipiens TaxID=38569 RepID=A0ABD1D9H0_CULPP